MTVASGEFFCLLSSWDDYFSTSGKCYFQGGKGFSIREKKKAKNYSIMSMTSLSESPNDQTEKCWLAHHIKTNEKILLNVGLEHSFFSITLYISTNLAT